MTSTDIVDMLVLLISAVSSTVVLINNKEIKKMANGKKLIAAGTGRDKVGPNTLLSFRTNMKGQEAVDWAYIDAEALKAAVTAVTMAGAAIMLGRTSDGGAYSICVLNNNEKLKEYPHGKMECEELLASLVDHFS